MRPAVVVKKMAEAAHQTDELRGMLVAKGKGPTTWALVTLKGRLLKLSVCSANCRSHFKASKMSSEGLRGRLRVKMYQ